VKSDGEIYSYKETGQNSQYTQLTQGEISQQEVKHVSAFGDLALLVTDRNEVFTLKQGHLRNLAGASYWQENEIKHFS
jgi:hypothetical protein